VLSSSLTWLGFGAEMTGFSERRVNLLLMDHDHSVTMRYRTTLRLASCVVAAAAIVAFLGGASVYAQSGPDPTAEPAWTGVTLPKTALIEPEASVLVTAKRLLQLSAQTQTPPQGGVVLSLTDQARGSALFNDFSPAGQGQALVAQFSATATAVAGGPFDVGIAQRARFEDGGDGQLIRRGAEVRFGQGLADMVGASAFDPNKSAWYFFAASDGQALTWAPGTLEGLAYQQERITVGDLQAGFSYERQGVQTSFSYLQREVSNSTRGAGAQSRSETESFVGATITVRR
jgi:hypothetical protein